MSRLRRRAESAGALLKTGLLGGPLLLVLCVMASDRQGVRAETFGAVGGDEPRDLLFPVPAVSSSAMADTFNDARGERLHHAVDIMAPRHSDVVAVADGSVARLATSVAGGIAVYEWSAGRRFVYYYAHLQEYAPGLVEGQTIRRGQVLGYVGTTGNAPRNSPHLHFAIARVEKKDQWWGGTPIDPFPIWR
ncbi:MAG: M23 family metallopeptidase [Vicinamibacteria bacterium]|nr:M23 family metallopeptidase [Vicinamibacteria bacterium]